MQAAEISYLHRVAGLSRTDRVMRSVIQVRLAVVVFADSHGCIALYVVGYFVTSWMNHWCSLGIGVVGLSILTVALSQSQKFNLYRLKNLQM